MFKGFTLMYCTGSILSMPCLIFTDYNALHCHYVVKKKWRLNAIAATRFLKNSVYSVPTTTNTFCNLHKRFMKSFL